MAKNSNSARVPLVELPHPYENIQGYVLRLTELNLYERTWWIYNLLDSENAAVSFAAFRRYAVTLPPLTGIDPSLIHRIIYISEQGGNFNKIVVGDRGVLPAGLLDIVHPRICPGCVHEFGIACALWDLKYYKVCTRHECYLVDRCCTPGCRKKITWWRSSLARCGGCDRPYRVPPDAQKVDAELLRFSALLERQWGVPFEPVHLEPKSDFERLEFSEFYSLLHLLKNRLSGNVENTSIEPRRNVQAMARLLGSCYTNWPLGYYDYLEEIIGMDMKEGRGFSTINTSLFGSFFNFIMAGGIQSYFEPLKYELLEYVHGSKFNVQVTGKGGNRLNEVSVDQKQYLTRTEVMEKLHISAATFRRLFKTGALKGKILHMGKQHVYRVEAGSVVKYKEICKLE